jgi:hypothetical protein
MIKRLFRKKVSSMFREFIYLDMNRVQSIIAQLQEGLLTDIASGNQKEVSAKAGIEAQVLSLLLPATGEVQGKYATDIKANKVLHDFAFDLAFKSLRQEGLMIENVDEFEREKFPASETAFVLTKGQPKLYDFSALYDTPGN